MNSKRQTIWLVSMLSLMVVLSAYYLFTDDTDKLNQAANQTQTEQIEVKSTGIDADKANAELKELNGKDAASVADPQDGKTSGIDNPSLTEIADAHANEANAAEAKQNLDTDVKAKDQTDSSSGTVPTKDTEAKETLTDAQILDKVEQQGQSAKDYFTYQQLTNREDLSQKMSDLTAVMANTSESVEVQSKAYDDYTKLEDQQARQTRIEEQLLKDGYENVVLLNESGKWKIVVASGTLEKAQAVQIIDLVTKELNVAPDKVMVQYRNN